MLPYLKPICTSTFYIFDNYDALHFYDIEKNQISDDEINEIFNNNEIPNDTHRFIYSHLKNINSEDVDLTGIIATITTSNQNTLDWAKQRNLKSYNPLDDSMELYTEIAKLDPINEKQLLKFIKEYGIPVSGGIATDTPEMHSYGDLREIVIDEMDVLSFAYSLEEYKEAFYLWNAINENDTKILNDTKVKFEEEATELQQSAILDLYETVADKLPGDIEDEIEKTISKKGEDINWRKIEQLAQEQFESEAKERVIYQHPLWRDWKNVKDKSLKLIAKVYLAYLLNQQSSGVTSHEVIGGEIVSGIMFNDLLEVAYFQLSQAVHNHKEFRKCLNCNHLFEITHEGRKFCPPLPGRKRSTCENSYNQRLKRKRRREKKK